MRLVPLTPDYPLVAFDCGDDDLNKFLLEDAKPSLALRVANTFILTKKDEDEHTRLMYFDMMEIAE